MRIENVMTKAVATCVPEQSLNDAARIMWERDCGIIPIVLGPDDRRVVGVVTDRDICIAAYTKGRALAEIPIGDVMVTKVTSCRAADDVSDAEQLMQQAQVHRLPVLDESEQLAGVVSLADLARASARRAGARAQVTSAEVGETLAAIRRSRELQAAPA